MFDVRLNKTDIFYMFGKACIDILTNPYFLINCTFKNRRGATTFYFPW